MKKNTSEINKESLEDMQVAQVGYTSHQTATYGGTVVGARDACVSKKENCKLHCGGRQDVDYLLPADPVKH